MAKTINPAILKLLIVIIFVAFAWALLSKACHSNPQPIIVKQDSINATSKRVIAKLEKENKDFKQQLDITNDFIKDVMADREAKESDLKTATEDIRNLSHRVHELSWRPPVFNGFADSVSWQALQKPCDSLAQQVLLYTDKQAALKRTNDSLQMLLFQSSHLKYSLVLRLEMMRSQCAGVVNDLNKLISKAVAPHRKLFLGIEGYSTQSALQSIQAGVILADKKDNMFGISAGLEMDGRVVGGVKYYHLLKLHK